MEPCAPFSGHPRYNACSRSPLQRSHARRSQATHGPTRARGPRYNDPCSGYRFRGRRATGYNRTMSETAAGRVGVVVLLVLLAAVVVVPSLPGDPGAVRLAGVGAARPAGVPRHAALTLSAATAFLGVAWRAARRPVGDAAVLAGAAGVVLPLVVIGAVAVAVPPWTAWSRTASRPALTFGERSAWVTDGRRLERSTTLVFTEPHRVTALNPGVYRVVEEVVEGDAPRSVTREWRLAAGEALTLRPGDRLILEAGA